MARGKACQEIVTRQGSRSQSCSPVRSSSRGQLHLITSQQFQVMHITGANTLAFRCRRLGSSTNCNKAVDTFIYLSHESRCSFLDHVGKQQPARSQLDQNIGSNMAKVICNLSDLNPPRDSLNIRDPIDRAQILVHIDAFTSRTRQKTQHQALCSNSGHSR